MGTLKGSQDVKFMVRVTEELVQGLDRVAAKMAKAVPGLKLKRSAVARMLMEEGIKRHVGG